jgi:hypothetical protein
LLPPSDWRSCCGVSTVGADELLDGLDDDEVLDGVLVELSALDGVLVAVLLVGVLLVDVLVDGVVVDVAAACAPLVATAVMMPTVPAPAAPAVSHTAMRVRREMRSGEGRPVMGTTIRSDGSARPHHRVKPLLRGVRERVGAA